MLCDAIPHDLWSSRMNALAVQLNSPVFVGSGKAMFKIQHC